MWRWTAALLLLAFALVYRFNALGGGFGGFDNDHFLHFVYAKQVQAGEQPLRDFLDGGLQGARPSLTYEVSAAAQRLFGDNLRSEAWLTVAALALGTVVTFAAASAVAPAGWALLTSLLTVLISPKLYNYPKVLVLAVTAALIVGYARKPSWGKLAAMGVTTAVAFLFRHDYAVYCAAGFSVVIAWAHPGAWKEGARRLASVGGLAFVLVLPSLVWVEWHAGLLPYLRNGLDMGAVERARTAIGWPAFGFSGEGIAATLLFANDANGEAWLYYLFLAIPLAALAAARRQPDGLRPAIVALGVMTLLLAYLFLRGNLAARFGDMAPPVAVLGAFLLARATSRQSSDAAASRRFHIIRLAGALALTLVTASAVWSIGSVWRELETAGLLESPAAAARRAARVSAELAGLPGAIWSAPEQRPIVEASRYLHRCTEASDRVLLVSYAPEVLAFADRRFAGGRATANPRFYDGAAYTDFTIARLSEAPAALVLVDESRRPSFPRLVQYIERHYDPAGRMTFEDGRILDIFAPAGRVRGTWGEGRWPCLTDSPRES